MYRLDEVARVVAGGKSGLSGKHFVDSGYPAYGAGGLNGMLSTWEHEDGAVILSSIGARCGKCFFPSGKWSSLANTQLIFPNPELVDRRFLWYLLDDESRWHRSGSAQPYIKPSDVKSHLVPIPPLPEQRRIAALLDEVESIRQTRSTAIEHLDLVEKSILQAMLDRTNGSRRRVVFGEIVESSQLGLVRGSNDFGAVGEFGYLRMDAITRSGRVDLRLVQRTDADAKELARAELSDGDLLFNTRNSRELVGKSAVFYGPSKTLFNNNILRVRFKEDISPAYIAAMLRTGEVKSQLEARKRGTTSVFAVYYRDLASIELEIPSATEMDAFEMSVRRVHEIRLASERALKITDQLKAALHYKAFKGQL